VSNTIEAEQRTRRLEGEWSEWEPATVHPLSVIGERLAQHGMTRYERFNQTTEYRIKREDAA
jgi:hypothetical protein